VLLRATLTARGMKLFELAELAEGIRADGSGGGIIEVTIPKSEVVYYARRFLAVGSEATVISPPELIAAIRQQAAATLELYPQPTETGLA